MARQTVQPTSEDDDPHLTLTDTRLSDRHDSAVSGSVLYISVASFNSIPLWTGSQRAVIVSIISFTRSIFFGAVGRENIEVSK